jgi:hypothetical protein
MSFPPPFPSPFLIVACFVVATEYHPYFLIVVVHVQVFFKKTNSEFVIAVRTHLSATFSYAPFFSLAVMLKDQIQVNLPFKLQFNYFISGFCKTLQKNYNSMWSLYTYFGC